MTTNPDLRVAIRLAGQRDEAASVAALAIEMAGLPRDEAAIAAEARTLIDTIRRERRGASGVDLLMHEFSLSSHEGVALMCLAEALLRIPDTATVDRLIRDKISLGNWEAHLGGSSSLFVNATTWGLMLTGRLLAPREHGAWGEVLNRVLARGGEPLIRRGVDFALRLLGRQFVMGESIEAALERSAGNEALGYTHSFDMLGEAALTTADAESYATAYATAIHAIGQAAKGRGVRAGPGISVKLSALHPRYGRSQRERVMTELLPRLRELALLARQYDIGLNIDAEEAERLELSLDLFAELAADAALAGWDGLGFVVQAYQKRGPYVIDWLLDLARCNRRRLMVRLVKGAYWDSEIKRAQVEGLADYPVFTRKAHADLCYLVCAGRLLAAADVLYPQFATHNAHTLVTVRRLAQALGVAEYEFQCLHGMGETLYGHVVGAGGQRCRIYAPVGSHASLLPYLVRRLLENGANSSFVNRLVDPAVSVDELLADPLQTVRRDGGRPHPAVPLPRDILGGGRVNSAGFDLSDEPALAWLGKRLTRLNDILWQARPRVGGAPGSGSPPRRVRNPAHRDEVVGQVVEADAAAAERALALAAAAAEGWYRTPPVERAAALRRAADLLEAQREALVSLGIREAGKTWGSALAEVREAVDYLRYYGQQLLAGDFQGAEAPGPVVCISPWNFPLAIFVGEISAALAAGSPVIAKPARQTPLIATLAVEVLHRAGIPPDVLHCLPGRGDELGSLLTADPRVRGVVFTGSTAVARQINQRLAARPAVRLIAETGGQNAMIVDSTALPEQVVRDVLVSAFDSAGQRCSALRVLCLQADIADRVLDLLKAAMRELVIGDPADLATDVGPVIDAAAQTALRAHIDDMRRRGRPVYELPLPPACADGCFVAPTLIEIEAMDELHGEVFGPVVHVLRFAADQLAAVIAAINATGYGLTLGLHTRIDETVAQVAAQARVGNLYVNRNMIGAVVGVQPFGGEGLSGTGPKAGGPLYLHRLADTRSLTPAALGGSARHALLAAVSPCRQLAAWAASTGQPALAQVCGIYAEQSLLYTHIELPGPTGERNTLSFAPRGTLLCLAGEEDELLRQLAAVFASGNGVVAVDCPASRNVLARLPTELAASVGLWPAGDYRGVAGVLFAGEQAAAVGLQQRLADEPGALIPLYRPAGPRLLYPLHRMLLERVLTINTAAAGGNASLMVLAG